MARAAVSRLSGLVPAVQWLGRYRPAWVGADLVAGVTLAAYAIPVSLAYASLAGLPPHVGLYGYLLGGLGYALLGSSRHLAVGPTSAISMLVGASIVPLAAGDPARLAAIASLAALEVGALCVLAWALKLSSLTSFISETVLLGFKAGAGLSIAATQLPNLLGVPGGGHHFFARLAAVAGQLGDANPATIAVGASALVLLLLGERVVPGRPVALPVVVAAIVVTAMAGLEDRVATVGAAWSPMTGRDAVCRRAGGHVLRPDRLAPP